MIFRSLKTRVLGSNSTMWAMKTPFLRTNQKKTQLLREAFFPQEIDFLSTKQPFLAQKGFLSITQHYLVLFRLWIEAKKRLWFVWKIISYFHEQICLFTDSLLYGFHNLLINSGLSSMRLLFALDSFYFNFIKYFLPI